MMEIGMLWNRKKGNTLVQDIGEARAYYKDKYKKPSTCVTVHSSTEEFHIDGLLIHKAHYILPGLLWIGEEK